MLGEAQGRWRGGLWQSQGRGGQVGGDQLLGAHVHGHRGDAAQGRGHEGPGGRLEGGLGQGRGLEEHLASRLLGRGQGQAALRALRSQGWEGVLAAGADSAGGGNHGY